MRLCRAAAAADSCCSDASRVATACRVARRCSCRRVLCAGNQHTPLLNQRGQLLPEPSSLKLKAVFSAVASYPPSPSATQTQGAEAHACRSRSPRAAGATGVGVAVMTASPQHTFTRRGGGGRAPLLPVAVIPGAGLAAPLQTVLQHTAHALDARICASHLGHKNACALTHT
jgi:hypothetical protein